MWYDSEGQGRNSVSLLVSMGDRMEMSRPQGRPTGNTKGIPPRTAFEPSSTALELRKSRSLPVAVFQEVTVAPWSRTSMDSPVGKLAVTHELSSEMLT